MSGSDREGRSIGEEERKSKRERRRERKREKQCAAERQHYAVGIKEHLGFPP